MEQTKALNALEPFLALSKSATSPRAAADLVTRATSAPNTFLFSELLQTPAIQKLAESEFASHLVLLQIFAYGTYSSYKSTEGLPALAEAQATKLRQLSLLSLARNRQNLSYTALQDALDLPGSREIETLVISAVYAGLLHATLDPARATVQVSSVAPLRDLAPGAIPDMAAALKTWADRCTTTLSGLELQIKEIRTTAAARQREQRAADEKLQKLMGEHQDGNGPRKYELPSMTRDLMARRGFNKRSVMDVGNLVDNDSMDVDESEEEKKRASKRKL
ncbi:ACOB-like protein [Fusarium heterosporum]|uniref:ACOB-like protein n=1 Tax=Fusarium heterosporum TaxID=42747 RepID=A0A8H5WMN4_FUSHE|nr:ACOB-like protein [Fusarium heterosporum]